VKAMLIFGNFEFNFEFEKAVYRQGDQKFWKKSPNFKKSSPKSLQAKKGQNIYN
jgi:hypothetical protein